MSGISDWKMQNLQEAIVKGERIKNKDNLLKHAYNLLKMQIMSEIFFPHFNFTAFELLLKLNHLQS